MAKKLIFGFVVILLVVSMVQAYDFTPRRNINLENRYNLTGVLYGHFDVLNVSTLITTNLSNEIDSGHVINPPTACPSGTAMTHFENNFSVVTCSDYWIDSSGDTMNGNLIINGNLSTKRINNVLFVNPGNSSDIQVKINNCPSGGVCEVIIPPGTYTISSPIVIENKPYFQLRGSGPDTKLVVSDGANLNYIIKVSESSFSEINDLYIDGNKDSQTGGNGYGIFIYNSARMSMGDLWIVNTYGDSIYIEGSSGAYSHAGQYHDIKILYSGGNAITLNPYTFDSQFSNIWIGETTLHGINLKSGSNRFVNLHVWSSGDDNIEARTNENHFSNCYIESSSKSGFDIYGTSGTQITNCYIRGNGERGIMADGTTYTGVSNCKIINNGDYGISTSSDSSNNLFIHNSIINNNASGILLAGRSNIVSNNQIINNSYEGIKVSSGKENVINGNVIYNNGKSLVSAYVEGINLIDQSKDNDIFNNKFGNTNEIIQKKGIVLNSETESNFIHGNTFFNTTTPIQTGGSENRYQMNKINNHSVFDEIYVSGNEAKEIIFNSTDTTLANDVCVGGMSINTNDASSSGKGEKGFIKFITDSIYGNGVKLIFGTSPTNKPYAITRMTISKEGRFGFGVDVNDSDESTAFATFNGSIKAPKLIIDNENYWNGSGTYTTNIRIKNISGPDIWFYGDYGADPTDTTNVNLVSLNKDDDGTGAHSRITLNFWPGGTKYADNYALGIEAHNNGSWHPKHVTFYSDLLNNTNAEKAFEWRWGEWNSGMFYFPVLTQLRFSEAFKGYDGTSSPLHTGVATDDYIYEILLDYNDNNTGDTFRIYSNGRSNLLFKVSENGETTTAGKLSVGSVPANGAEISLENDNVGIARGTYWNGSSNNSLVLRSYDGFDFYSTHNPKEIVAQITDEGEVNFKGVSNDGSGKVVCVKSDGNLGTCSSAPDSYGRCTCG